MVVSHRPPVFSQKASVDSLICKAFGRFCDSTNSLTYRPETGLDSIVKPETAPSPYLMKSAKMHFGSIEREE